MDVTVELAKRGFKLKDTARLNYELVIEWPWIVTNAPQHRYRPVPHDVAVTPRTYVGILMLEYLEQHPEDKNRPHNWLMLHGLRARMTTEGWRNPHASKLYMWMPEGEAAWFLLLGEQSRPIIEAIRLAAAEMTNAQTTWPFHNVMRRAIAQYLVDQAAGFNLDTRDQCNAVYLEIGRAFVEQFKLQ